LIELFLEQLAEYSKENNLSDITYYLCNTSLKFRDFFLRFIFPELQEIPTIVDIQREFVSNDKTCRIDFKFEIENKFYLIENKIYDRDYHYEPYLESYPNCIIGFIANYDVQNLKIYQHKNNWETFYSSIQKKLLPILKNDEEKKLIKGYLNYVKGVCGIMVKRDFKPELSCDIYYLNSIFSKLVNLKNDKGFSINNKTKSCTEYRSGKYFQFNKGEISHWYWIGLYTADFSNTIYIEACNRQISEFDNKIGKYFVKPYFEENSIWFELKEKYFNELNCKDGSFDKKYEILSFFFNEVMSISEEDF
jgi:hypothetical protein